MGNWRSQRLADKQMRTPNDNVLCNPAHQTSCLIYTTFWGGLQTEMVMLLACIKETAIKMFPNDCTFAVVQPGKHVPILPVEECGVRSDTERWASVC